MSGGRRSGTGYARIFSRAGGRTSFFPSWGDWNSLRCGEPADGFAPPQLHQLRGRVGRGSRPSVCFLMVGNEQGEEAAARLSVMERTNDGFRIAEEELSIRGPGAFAGLRA